MGGGDLKGTGVSEVLVTSCFLLWVLVCSLGENSLTGPRMIRALFCMYVKPR